MEDKEQKIEEMKKIEDKVIEKIAQTLVFVAKEIYQKELKNQTNNLKPSENLKIGTNSVFCLNSKSYARNKN